LCLVHATAAQLPLKGDKIFFRWLFYILFQLPLTLYLTQIAQKLFNRI